MIESEQPYTPYQQLRQQVAVIGGSNESILTTRVNETLVDLHRRHAYVMTVSVSTVVVNAPIEGHYLLVWHTATIHYELPDAADRERTT